MVLTEKMSQIESSEVPLHFSQTSNHFSLTNKKVLDILILTLKCSRQLPRHCKQKKSTPVLVKNMASRRRHSQDMKAAITMVLSQDVGSFPIIHEKKNLGNHSRGIR